jgi:hypothetical protein
MAGSDDVYVYVVGYFLAISLLGVIVIACKAIKMYVAYRWNKFWEFLDCLDNCGYNPKRKDQ